MTTKSYLVSERLHDLTLWRTWSLTLRTALKMIQLQALPRKILVIRLADFTILIVL